MNLICACCGGIAPARHQWHNQDAGHGICPDCWERLMPKYGIEEMIRLYGAPGIHHTIKPRPVAETPLKTIQRLRQAESLDDAIPPKHQDCDCSSCLPPTY